MGYKIYLYKSMGVRAEALCISMTNRAFGNDFRYDDKDYSVDRSMLPFDADGVAFALNARLKVNGELLGVAKVKRTPRNGVEYVYATTSYENARELVIASYSIAAENGLVMYDAEMDRSFFWNDLYDAAHSEMQIRVKALNAMIRENVEGIWHLRSLDAKRSVEKRVCSYVLTLKKIKGVTFEQRTEQFYNVLRQGLAETEKLYFEHGFFAIEGNGYVINYTLEGYKKHADRVGYFENGKPIVALMKRMSCETAFKKCNELKGSERCDVWERIYLDDWIRRYPDPAERFAKSVAFATKLKRKRFELFVGAVGYGNGEFVFHVVTKQPERTSALRIEEDNAGFILAIIGTIYPYIRERYYGENHIPGEMMYEIVSKLKEVRELVLRDPYSEQLSEYTSAFPCYVLGNDYSVDTDVRDIINAHRHWIAGLYEEFITWAEDQLEYYAGLADMLTFNIQGI